ncbi:translocon-associated protein, gamma subunit (TRAP-gamma) domain-containing protein [Ditylenchus destructor]|uniref:Translocon-associated protein subunit gamma n=1 Tax=Ditylenchus destructor TaxID=166010 RepID=A0AAD4R1Z7_9BILA|nr:translocon-associated protein, gamma subunit (TRAP-gamma) domain-containing protein [Ditylenchus destructor]
MSKTAKFTKEDELLLKDFSSAVSKTGTLTFYAISTLVGVTPIYLFYEVHQMEVADSWFIWIAAVIGVSYLLAQSYKNVKHVLKHQIVIKRGDAIAREMNRQLGDDKKMFSSNIVPESSLHNLLQQHFVLWSARLPLVLLALVRIADFQLSSLNVRCCRSGSALLNRQIESRTPAPLIQIKAVSLAITKSPIKMNTASISIQICANFIDILSFV